MPIKGYEQNEKLLEAKKKLFQGKSPGECSTCVLAETNTGKSFRTLANDFHPHLTQEVLDNNALYSCIRHVSIVGSNICNLQCLPCMNGSYKRSKELYDIGLLKILPVVTTMTNIDDIAKLENIEQLTLCSGEPFYDKRSLHLLDILIRNGRSRRIRLDINTNLTCITQQKLEYLVENFDQVLIKGSIDGIRETHEYLRYPSSWHEIDQSVELILSMSDVQFIITTALSNLSLLGYVDLINYFSDLGVKHFFITNVTDPVVLNSANLPGSLKEKTLEKLVDLQEKMSNGSNRLPNRLLNSIDTCINICRRDYPWDAKLLSDFLQKHDDFRQSNWRKIWPQLAEFC
jgi:sulfatase maturation enzyme AslB (radical SAM superfamily)